MKKLVVLLSLLALSCAVAFAQSRTIKGTVIGDDGLPVPGASVVVKGTTTGTITDFDGNFSFTVQQGAETIVVHFVGYKDAEIALNDQTTTYNVTLYADTEELEEIVVTGMHVMDKRLFTGATTKLSAKDVMLDGVPEISRALEGRAAGVSVQNVSGTFGTAPKIRVRGATSIYGSSKPLWVVDGVIMEDVTEVSADDLSKGDPETLISSVIAGLNSDDIESFQILKDGSATSIYGARAMAGVIVVTTKKGKAGTNHISYTGEYTYRLKPNYRNFNIMNSQEQMDVYRELERAGYLNFSDVLRKSDSGVYGKMYQMINTYDPITGKYELANTEEAKNAYLQECEMRNTDWFDLLFNNTVSHSHAISMTSGTDKASYYTSMSLMSDPGWYKKSKVSRLTMNLNALYNISKAVTLNLIGTGAYRKQEAPGTLGQDIDVVSGEVKRDFDINPYSYSLNTSRALDPNVFYKRNYADFNILHELDNNYMKFNVVDLKFQGELKVKPISKVELAGLVAYKYSGSTQSHEIKDYSNQAMAFRAMDDATMRDNNSWLYKDPDNVNSLPISVLERGGFYKETKYTMNSWDVRATVSYNDSFDDTHIVNFFGGMEMNAADRKRTWFNGVGMQYEMGMLPSFQYEFFKRSKEENTNYYSVDEGRVRSQAFFGTATYSFMGRYTINGTVRYEGTNKLGKSRSARWLPTWNVSLAWNAHEEDWFKNQNAVSTATLKGSYSLTGDRGPSSVTNSRVVIGSYNPWRPSTNTSESGLEVLDLENSALTYEKKHELNLGASLGFINNRINLDFDWYKRKNFDLIGKITTMGIGGRIDKLANVANMESHGFEFTLSTTNIKTQDFRWTTDLIFSKTETEVTKFDSNATVIGMITGSGFTSKGYPVRSLFSMNFQGLTEDGLPTFINENGEKTISDIYFQERIKKDHLVYEGPTDPTWSGSFGNTLSWKGLKLNVFITYSGGNAIRLDPVFRARYTDLQSTPREFKNRWTVSGDENKTDIPVIATRRMNTNDAYLSYAYNAYNYSTARVAKGDFVRMKEISLAYQFPKSICEKLTLTDLSLKLQATNLFLIYADDKLNGQDPEFFNAGGVAAPTPKQFTCTLRVGL
ncbi:MAG: SusC/RagA family TonB-linked outer membrane protein [Bacteroidia bacterium]|nr:SusC/RagA family TonB-linked outer membrane protein [Bacteroidia bacterium]